MTADRRVTYHFSVPENPWKILHLINAQYCKSMAIEASPEFRIPLTSNFSFYI